MLKILNFEEILALMNEISGLVDLHDKKDTFFSTKAKEWLRKLEKTLENNKLAISGNIGALRSLLISAEQGAIPAPIQLTSAPSRKKITNATASYAIQKASETVSSFLTKDYERFSEAERQTNQLVTYMEAKGLLHGFNYQNMNTETLKNIWQIIRSDAELAPGAVSIESLVGLYDALIILNRRILSQKK